jgi:hypothetical protein
MTARRRTLAEVTSPLEKLRDRVAEREIALRNTVELSGDFRIPRSAALLCRRLWMALPALAGIEIAQQFNTLRPSRRVQQAITEYIGQLGVTRHPTDARHLLLILLKIAKQMAETEIAGEAEVIANATVWSAKGGPDDQATN